MGSDSAESEILIIDWWEAEVAEKGKAMWEEKINT
jgi:hypothetical protein